MEFCLKNRVFLQRNGKLLLFYKNGMYNGDDINISDYIDRGLLRYITVEYKDGEIKQTNCYFANTTDQHLTQYGEWVYIENANTLPTNELIHLVLDNYYHEGLYDNKVRLITKSNSGISTTTIGE